MSYYDTYLKLSKDPAIEYREFYQELVNEEFDNASTLYKDVEEEIAFGTLEFKPVKVRVNTIIDAKTGQRVNDDYKKIIFQDLSYSPPLGTRFRFNNNIWITFSIDNIKTDTSSIYVRRCNSTINTQDVFGNIHREPCYIDYKVTETQPFRETSIDIPNGRISVQCQSNKWTTNINVNDRYVFGGVTYKIRESHNYDRQETFDQHSTKILSFYADYDEIAPDDNLELEIANYKEYNYVIDIPSEIKGVVGDSDIINASLMLDGKPSNEDLIWTSTNEEVVSVEFDGRYTMNKVGEASIIVSLKGNPKFTSTINIIVEDGESSIQGKNIDVLQPDVKRIKLNATQRFSIFEYIDGVKQDTQFEIVCSGIPKNNYYFGTNGNEFYITNRKPDENNLLKVDCTNKKTNNVTTVYIELGGLF